MIATWFNGGHVDNVALMNDCLTVAADWRRETAEAFDEDGTCSVL